MRCLSLSLSFHSFSPSSSSSSSSPFFLSFFCSHLLPKEGRKDHPNKCPKKKEKKLLTSRRDDDDAKKKPSSFVVSARSRVGKQQRAKEKKKHGSNFCAQRHIKGAFSHENRRRDVRRACALPEGPPLREDPCFVGVRLSFFVCVFSFAFCSASEVLTPFSLSVCVCVCVCDEYRRCATPKSVESVRCWCARCPRWSSSSCKSCKSTVRDESSFSRGDPDGLTAMMSDDDRIPIARRQKFDLKSRRAEILRRASADANGRARERKNDGQKSADWEKMEESRGKISSRNDLCLV